MDMLTVDLTDVFLEAPLPPPTSLSYGNVNANTSGGGVDDDGDSMSAWLSNHPAIGSTVELWGKNIDINVVASMANTISYELLCNIKRVPKVYTRMK
jgi:hypothetical protein